MTDGNGESTGDEPTAKPDLLDKTFNFALILKGLDGLLELVGGILLIVISPETINRLAHSLTQHELSQDPHDFLAHHLLRLTANLHNTQTFGALYLLTHGLVKVWLVWALLRSRLWAYPTAIVVFAAFGAYQMYRWSYTHSVAMLALTVQDVFVILLTWAEYRRLRGERRAPVPA